MASDYALSAHLFAYESLRFEHLKEAAEAGFRKIELWAMTPNFDVGDGSESQNPQRPAGGPLPHNTLLFMLLFMRI